MRAEDALGNNWTDSAAATWVLDTSLPDSLILAPAVALVGELLFDVSCRNSAGLPDCYSFNFTLSLPPAGSLADCSKRAVVVQRGAVAAAAAEGSSARVLSRAVAVGVYTLEVVAVNRAGNVQRTISGH